MPAMPQVAVRCSPAGRAGVTVQLENSLLTGSIATLS